METRELMIGNLVSDEAEGKTWRVISIEQDYVIIHNGVGNLSKQKRYLFPIKITSNWLLSLDFYQTTESLNEWRRGLFVIRESNLNYYSNGVKLKSIHQLQNLYFALTGEELTIKD